MVGRNNRSDGTAEALPDAEMDALKSEPGSQRLQHRLEFRSSGSGVLPGSQQPQANGRRSCHHESGTPIQIQSGHQTAMRFGCAAG